MSEYDNKGVYCPLLHFCKEYPEKCSLFYNQSYMKCTIYCQYFDFLGNAFDTFMENIPEEEEELESFKTWIDRELTQIDVFYRKIVLDHLKTHLKVSKDQLKGVDKEKLFWDFDNAIENQIKILMRKEDWENYEKEITKTSQSWELGFCPYCGRKQEELIRKFINKIRHARDFDLPKKTYDDWIKDYEAMFNE